MPFSTEETEGRGEPTRWDTLDPNSQRHTHYTSLSRAHTAAGTTWQKRHNFLLKRNFSKPRAKERNGSGRERSTCGDSYYTVTRVCHLETRVLQARRHGQACSREDMHRQLKWHIPPLAPSRARLPTAMDCGHRAALGAGFVLESLDTGDQQDRDSLHMPLLHSAAGLCTEGRQQSRCGRTGVMWQPSPEARAEEIPGSAPKHANSARVGSKAPSRCGPLGNVCDHGATNV